MFPDSVNDFCKASSVRRDDNRGLVALIVPAFGASLWIKIDNYTLETVDIRSASEIEG
ncbi:MAG: hypothetical protein OXC09_10695 [Truepera sp.]|nr:hypothetical protein [Truepera sp.]